VGVHRVVVDAVRRFVQEGAVRAAERFDQPLDRKRRELADGADPDRREPRPVFGRLTSADVEWPDARSRSLRR
jgi:hypothetical protein